MSDDIENNDNNQADDHQLGLNIPSVDPIEPQAIAVSAPRASGAMRLLVTFLLLCVFSGGVIGKLSANISCVL